MISNESPTLADVFRAGFDDYCRECGALPLAHYKIANAIRDCRTPVLGGRLYHCEECGHRASLFNSCRNRHCPQCQAIARAQWVEKRTGELLPTTYFHVVFTVPQQLKPFALRNKKAFYTLMFKAVADTLAELGANPKHLGATIGIIAILHTWTQTLMDHPHIHCVIPAGGLCDDGVEWRHCRKDFLFPVQVVKKLYRGKFMALFKQAVSAGEIQLTGLPAQSRERYQQLLDALYRIDWVVYMKESFTSPHAVIKYLGAYTNRIAISNARIKAITNGCVTFTYIDRRRGGAEKLLTLPLSEFIRRFFLHAMPSGFVRIRYFGFLANRDRSARIEQCRSAIQGCAAILEPLDPPADSGKTGNVLLDNSKTVIFCPLCRKRSVTLREVIPKRPRTIWPRAA